MDGEDRDEAHVAVIADIVGSRRLADRAAAQRQIEEAIEQVERELSVALRPFRATVGDEFQGTFSSPEDALRTTLMLQLSLPEHVQLRFGIGIGAFAEFTSAGSVLTDGPGWWAARASINEVSELQRRSMPRSRTRVGVARTADEHLVRRCAALNAYAALRDELVGSMSARERRVTRARIRGMSQQQIAVDEGISQPSVSKLLRSSGSAAILIGMHSF